VLLSRYNLLFKFGSRRRKLFLPIYSRWLAYRQLRRRKKLIKSGEHIRTYKCVECKKLVSELDMGDHQCCSKPNILFEEVTE
jgi:hypothetical protein